MYPSHKVTKLVLLYYCIQVQLPATQTSSSHISPMSGPLFTEDRLNTSGNDQEMCD